MPDREEIERAIDAVFAARELQEAGLLQRRALKLLDQGVWAGTITPFYQARAEQRINSRLMRLWDAESRERVTDPRE